MITKTLLSFLLMSMFSISLANALTFSNALIVDEFSAKSVSTDNAEIYLKKGTANISVKLYREDLFGDTLMKNVYTIQGLNVYKYGATDLESSKLALRNYHYVLTSPMEIYEKEGWYYFYYDNVKAKEYIHADFRDICGKEKANCSYTINQGKYENTLRVDFTSNQDIDPNFAGGAGTSISPYQITNWTALQEVHLYPTSYFVLMNNLSSSTNDYAGLGDNWTPIGNSTIAYRWKGVFNGNNYTISDLIVSKTTSYNGLFGYIADASGVSYIKDLRITNASITSTTTFSGILTGYLWANVTNVHVDGNVKCTIGCAGLAGTVASGAFVPTIRECSANANVTCTTQTCGGISGQSYGSIVDSYALGNVTTPRYAGGLVGSHNFNPNNRTYSSVKVTCPTNAGGLIGYTGGTSISQDSFWDINVSTKTTSVSGTGLTTPEMKNISKYTNWNIVATSTERNNGYPYLGNEVGSSSYVWYIWDGTTPSANCWTKIGTSLFITTPCYIPNGAY